MNAISKRSRLKAVPPKAAAPSRSKCLVYGNPGVGKTWTALDFPTVYFIDTEGGANLPHYTNKLEAAGGVYLGPAEGANDFATVLDQVRALAEEEHGFRTLVIDSISKLFNDTVAREADRIEQAVQSVLAQGLRTGDIYSEGTTRVGTVQMGDAVVAALQNAR